MVTGMEVKRKSYKLKLMQLITENPDMPQEKVIGLMSGLTGLSHRKIKLYWEELELEGRV